MSNRNAVYSAVLASIDGPEIFREFLRGEMTLQGLGINPERLTAYMAFASRIRDLAQNLHPDKIIFVSLESVPTLNDVIRLLETG